MYEGPKTNKDFATRFSKVDELNPDVFVATNLKYSEFETYNTNNYTFKLIPFNLWELDGFQKATVQKYTESHYSIWDDGSNAPDGYSVPKLYFNPDYMQKETQPYLGINCWKTRENEYYQGHEIITGPKLRQEGRFRFFYDKDAGHDLFPDYKLRLNIALTENPVNFDPLNPPNEIFDVIIRYKLLRGTQYSSPIEVTHTFSISDVDLSGNWHDLEIDYNYSMHWSKEDSPTSPPDVRGDPPALIEPIKYFHTYEVEYVIKMLTDQYTMYFNNFKLTDERSDGFDLLPGPIKVEVYSTLHDYDDNPKIVGWFGNDEPPVIDNYRPTAKIKQIISSYNAYPVRYTTGFTTGRNDLNMTGTVFEYSDVDTYKYLADPYHIVINQYMFNYPNPSPTGDENYQNVCNAYNKARSRDSEFAANIQTHEYSGSDAPLVNPSFQQINNHANLALLYGAKELGFYCLQSGANTTGLIDVNGNKIGQKFDFLKYYLFPRLRGAFGQEIKKLSPVSIFKYEIDDFPVEVVDDNFIRSIFPVNYPDAVLDVGYLEGAASNQKYIMLINRYNSKATSFDVNLKNLSSFQNWKLIEYDMSSSSTSLTPDPNGYYSFSTSISLGGSRLFKLMPTMAIGGNIEVDEIVENTEVTSTDEISVSPTKSISIVSSIWNIDNALVDFSNGSLTTTYDSEINLLNGAELVFSSWNNSLISCSSGNHPKLVWGRHPDPDDVIQKYMVYKKSGSIFMKIAEVDANTFEYVDETEVIIAPNSIQGAEKDYKVVVKYQNLVTEPGSNVVTVAVGIQIGKRGEAVEEIPEVFSLEQNYPNPFNPETRIKYYLKSESYVLLEILDIKGERVRKIVDTIQSTGEHTVIFDGTHLASGIYFYQLQVFDEKGKIIYSQGNKMVLLK